MIVLKGEKKMRKIEVPLLSLVINFLLFAILGFVFGSNIESIIFSGVLIICTNLWAVAEHIKRNNNVSSNKNNE